MELQSANNVVKNNANDYEVSFAKNSNVNKLVNLRKDGYELSWSVADAQKTKYSIIPSEEEELHNTILEETEEMVENSKQYKKLTKNKKAEAKEAIIENERKKIRNNISSELKYTDILPKVDLKYKVTSGQLKEDIILNEYTKDFQITMDLNTKGLAARLEEDNTISFFDEKDPSKVIFTTEAPFMYDQNGMTNQQVEVIFEETKQGYKLTLVPDDAWLVDPERSYPIIIDPVVNAKSSWDNIYDTYACSIDTEQKNNSMLLYVGKYSENVGITKSFIQFKLPDIGKSSMVTAAQMSFFTNSIKDGGVQVNAYSLTEEWDRKNMNWNDLPSYDPNVIDYRIVNQENTWYSFDVTSIAKDWYTDGENYGLMLQAKNDTEISGHASFNSSDNGTNGYGKPALSIAYVDYSGLEGYWTYHSQNVSRAGTGYVNDYNGNLIFLHNDLSMSGNRMPVSISHVYNTNDSQTDIGYGMGWRLNLSQKVGSTTLDDGHDYYFIDEDGTKHYFKKDDKGAYKDEAGKNLTLVKNSDNTYIITDKMDNQLGFNVEGNLTTITDNNSNSITLTYNSSKQVTSVTDGVGRKTKLEVSSDGKLLSITDPAGRKTRFHYTGQQLTKITYPDGEISCYSYDSENRLIEVINHDGYKISYSYSMGPVKRVTKVAETGTDGTTGNSFKLSYGFNKTSFIDLTSGNNRKESYQFNDYGNTITIQGNDADALYYEYGENDEKNKITSQSKLQKTIVNYVRNHNIEKETDFTLYSNGGSGSGSFSTERSYLGERSLKVTKTDNQNAQLFYQKFNVEAGKTYTFSASFCNNRYTKLGVNSLLDTDEELAREYAPDNEYDVIRINKVSKTWGYWICPDCHGRYGAYVNEREVGDNSCPYCKNERALEGVNSLVENHKLLTKEWSVSNKRKPSEFIKKNIYTALWNCPTCHNEYPARICDREVGDISCPIVQIEKLYRDSIRLWLIMTILWKSGIS